MKSDKDHQNRGKLTKIDITKLYLVEIGKTRLKSREIDKY